jgi:uncharacterized membrane protein YkvA (DUF1232 family)
MDDTWAGGMLTAQHGIERWKDRARRLRIEVHALYLAYKDPRVPWYAKAVAALVVGYALSPIDLIPDFIPVLGYLDDLVLVPLGIALVLKMMPKPVLDECRETAEKFADQDGPKNWVAAAVISAVWLLCVAWVIVTLLRTIRGLSL